ncbi:4-coumarate--CoA ligase-like 6 [Mercurialis annua]|uniref:4-coumarate--CoA ligase-like 6 n=1 Tax=Mercurialis annua TaxID=3986 RepID=UPI00215E77F5|nr:4-coumarate--CoA ligase-like 6 [Mercurialis annua]
MQKFLVSETSKQDNNLNPEWFCPKTGVYSSKHPPISLPTDPFLDVVSVIFSYKHNGVTALIDSSSGYSISYSNLFPLVKSMASALHTIGVKQGDVVLLLLPNSVYFPIILLGVLYLGAIVTTMNPLSTVLEITKQTSDCNASLAFSVLEKAANFESLGIPVISVPDNAMFDKDNKEFQAFYKLFNGSFDSGLRPVIRQDDAAAILYSSGTTGSSKGVVLTHRNFISMVELFVRFEASQYDYSGSDNVYLAALPMFHVYGLSLFATGLFSLGTSIVVMRRFDVDEMVKVIDRYGVTHFPVVPPLLQVLTKKAKIVGGSSLMSLKQVSSGAAPLFGKAIQDFVETLPLVDFIQGYGLTESTAVGTRGLNTKHFRKYSSIGLLAPNIEAKVMDWITGCFLPPGCSGELWIRGPGVMKEYLDNSEATASTIDKDGWLHTGDIVYIDSDGYLHLIDRLKEVIKYKGFQIAPADLEAVLLCHPDVLDAAVTAGIDKECGEIPVAFVVKRLGSMLTEEAIINYVAKQVAPYKKVRKVMFVQAIPKSAAGKILRRELRKFTPCRL